MDFEKKAKEIVNGVNKGYADETFVSEGYGYFDDLTAQIMNALRETDERARGEEREDISQIIHKAAQSLCELVNMGDATLSEIELRLTDYYELRKAIRARSGRGGGG